MSHVDYSRPVLPIVVANESLGPLLEAQIEPRQLITLKEFVKQLKGSIWRMLCWYRLCVDGGPESYVDLCHSTYIQPIVPADQGRSIACDRVDDTLILRQ